MHAAGRPPCPDQCQACFPVLITRQGAWSAGGEPLVMPGMPTPMVGPVPGMLFSPGLKLGSQDCMHSLRSL